MSDRQQNAHNAPGWSRPYWGHGQIPCDKVAQAGSFYGDGQYGQYNNEDDLQQLSMGSNVEHFNNEPRIPGYLGGWSPPYTPGHGDSSQRGAVTAISDFDAVFGMNDNHGDTSHKKSKEKRKEEKSSSSSKDYKPGRKDGHDRGRHHKGRHSGAGQH